MSKELVISSNRHETKVAILEDDQLVEIYFQHANEYSLAGSIHKGRVTRVLPGMQSAFVDLGLDRDTFLYVSDFFEENGDEYDRISDEKSSRTAGRTEPARTQTITAQAAPPAVAEPEPVAEAETPASVASAAPAERRGPAGDQDRDKKGRRGRRRRSRGGGFPDSKYASVTEELDSREEPAAEEDAEDAGLSEVILLPGESLAKYRNRGGASEAEAEAEPQEALASADLEEERLEAGQVTAEESYQAEPAAEAEEAPVSVAIAEPETEAEPSEEANVPEPAEAESRAEEEEPREQLAADIAEQSGPSAAETIEVPDAEPLGASLAGASHAETAVALPDEDPGDETSEPAELVAAEGAATGEPEGNQPITAAVRDQGTRFQHRTSRRLRRRRGGEQQAQRAPEPAPEAAPEIRASRTTEKPPLPSITDLLREGQEIIVQIAKEPLGQKGARITSHIALPGRYVVYMPTLEHLGVSRKISSDEERQRLKRILQAARLGMTGGFIVRTAGEGHSEEEIAADMAYLYNLWLDIRHKAEKKPAPVLLHHDLDIVQRILRDQLNDMFKAIWCDSEEVYESVLRFMQRFQPSLVGRVKMYTRPVPIFDAFTVSEEIEKALRPKVWLKSGGYIVINQTEALVAIDVNTGKYVGKSNRLEDTITKTNTEAVREIVRQIRLRDLGGIIVIDFIDMDERKNRQKVMQALEEAMRADRAPYKILQFNDFGLVAITRKRVKQSLERSLCTPCPTCEGASYVKSVQTVVGEMLQEAVKVRPIVEGKNVMLRAYPEVAKFLKSNTNTYLEELEEILGRPVIVISDPLLHPEKFDLAW